jgi:hypothetical protein
MGMSAAVAASFVWLVVRPAVHVHCVIASARGAARD